MQYSKILYAKGFIKQKNMVTQSQMTQIKFLAKLDSIKTFYNSLKAINFNEDANIIISEDGLKAIVEESKYVQASIYVTRECFSEFRLLGSEEVSIRLNLTVVTDCLSIFASPECSMKIIYKGPGAPLVLVLEQHDEDDLITEVSIKTKNQHEHLDFGIDEEDASYNSVIVRGTDFSHLLNEVNKAADVLEMFLSPKSPYFRLSSLGVAQAESNVEIAKTSDMFITFFCNASTTFRYKMTHIRLTMKALSLANKVALRNDSTGLLGMQIMVLSDGRSQIYIEYFITPLHDEDDWCRMQCISHQLVKNF